MSFPAPLPGALQSSPSLLLLPSMAVGAEGSLPTSPFSLLARPPLSLIPRLSCTVAPVWEQGTVPTCQPCRRRDFGSQPPVLPRLPLPATPCSSQHRCRRRQTKPNQTKPQPPSPAPACAARGWQIPFCSHRPSPAGTWSPRLPVPGSDCGQRRAGSAAGQATGRRAVGRPGRPRAACTGLSWPGCAAPAAHACTRSL